MRVRHRQAGRDFWVRTESPSDLAVIRESWVEDTYRLAEIGEEPRTVVDLGANIGAFAVLAAVRWPRARVVAVEPEPENYALLRANIDAAGLADRIAAMNRAVGPPGPMFVNGAHGKSRITGSPEWGAAVESLPLRDLFREAGVSRCDVLKVDIEGGEYDALLDADDETLRRIGHLRMEYHRTAGAWRLGELLSRLQAGFDLTVRSYTDMPALPAGTVHGAGMIFGRPNRPPGEFVVLTEAEADAQGRASAVLPIPARARRIIGAAVRSTSSTASRCVLTCGRTELGLDNGDYTTASGLDLSGADGDGVHLRWTGLSAGALVVGQLVCTTA